MLITVLGTVLNALQIFPHNPPNNPEGDSVTSPLFRRGMGAKRG